MERPQSIIWFERSYLGAVAVGLVNTATNWSGVQEQIAATPNSELLPSWFFGATIAVGLAINLTLWYFVARRGSVVAKWIVTVFFAIGLLGVLRAATSESVPPTLNVFAVVALVLQAVAVFMLFRGDAKPWFSGNKPVS